MIPNGTRFIGIAPEVDLRERKSAVLNKTTEPYTIEDIKGYKVFTALLTQSGGDATEYITSEAIAPFVIGVTYEIALNGGNADFTNIGAPNNNIDTRFIATGTTPNSWGDGGYVEISYNTGAPVATVLENTIGNVWFTFYEDGLYQVNSGSLFTVPKTSYIIGSAGSIEADVAIIDIRGNSGSTIDIFSTNSIGIPYNNQLVNTTIEIRVYN